MKYISFAIPCYNSAEYMENAIKSILKGGEDVEIIIVNDGSDVKIQDFNYITDGNEYTILGTGDYTRYSSSSSAYHMAQFGMKFPLRKSAG